MCRGRYGRVGQELTQWGKQNKNKTNSYSAEQFHITVILCLKITQHKLNSRRSICFHIVWKNHSPFKWPMPSWATLHTVHSIHRASYSYLVVPFYKFLPLFSLCRLLYILNHSEIIIFTVSISYVYYHCDLLLTLFI